MTVEFAGSVDGEGVTVECMGGVVPVAVPRWSGSGRLSSSSSSSSSSKMSLVSSLGKYPKVLTHATLNFGNKDVPAVRSISMAL